MPRDGGGDRRSLRDDVIRSYEKRLPQGRLEPNAGIWSRGHMHRQLERLRAGETVQLHRYGEVDRLPLAHRPARTELWTLAELRDGDVLVPVPSWRPGAPRPAEWTV